MTRASTLLLATWSAIALCWSEPVRAEIKLDLGSETLTVEGITKGGEVALLSVWIEPVLDGPHSHQTNIEESLTDEDGDGIVEFKVEREIPTMSIWGVVDLDSGESAVAAPASFALRPIQSEKETAFGKQLGRLIVMRHELRVLVVRPGVGKWRGRARDGVQGDVDGKTDRGVTLELDEFDADLRSETGPKIASGDTVIAIDRRGNEQSNVLL